MRALIATALLCSAAGLAGCSTIGTGYGDVQNGTTGRATFQWSSSDGGMTGTMSASLPSGESFSGQFYQLTGETRAERIDSHWDTWRPGWGAWGPGSTIVHVPRYSGHVVAKLGGSSGHHMRCDFNLRNPDAGIPGGSSGTCFIEGGETIAATFPATSPRRPESAS